MRSTATKIPLMFVKKVFMRLLTTLLAWLDSKKEKSHFVGFLFFWGGGVSVGSVGGCWVFWGFLLVFWVGFLFFSFRRYCRRFTFLGINLPGSKMSFKINLSSLISVK